MSFCRVFRCAVVGLALLAGSAKADLLFDNIAQTRDGSNGVDYGRNAQAFTTGNTGNNYNLNSIDVWIRYSNFALTNNPTLQIYSAISGSPAVPDAPVHTLTLAGTIDGPTNDKYSSVTYTSTGFSLLNNTTYFAVLSFLGSPGTNAGGTSPNAVRWGQVANQNTVGTFGAVGTWAGSMASWDSNQSNYPFMMKVVATVDSPVAVPEPATMTLAGIGLATMGVVRRFRKKA